MSSSVLFSYSVHLNRHAARSSSWGVRFYTGSSSHRKALPFSLNNAHTTVQSEPPEGTMLRMVMFGKPGAGKGTLAERLVKKFDIVSISTGDLLRQHIAQKTEIGRQAEEIVARGDLLPDELMLQVLTSKLDHLHDKHWIIDGFPRTIGQGELLDMHLRNTRMPLTLLVTLTVPEHILHARIAGRYVHPASGRVYNTNFNPPRVAGLDDLTGEPLVQRPDDTPEVYSRRLAAYERATAPLLGYYYNSSPATIITAGSSVSRGPSSVSSSGSGSGSSSVRGAMKKPISPKSPASPLSTSTKTPKIVTSTSPSPITRGLQILSLAGETSDEMWPTLERSVREMFPSVRIHGEVVKVRETGGVPLAVLSAAAENKRTVVQAAEEAIKSSNDKAN